MDISSWKLPPPKRKLSGDLRPGIDHRRYDDDDNDDDDYDDNSQNNRPKSHLTTTPWFSGQSFSRQADNSYIAEWPGHVEGGIYDAQAGLTSTEKVEAYLKHQSQVESEADNKPQSDPRDFHDGVTASLKRLHNDADTSNLPLCLLSLGRLRFTHFARFLLAQLHLNSLVGKRSPKAIHNALAKLATGSDSYDSAYNDVMGRIRGQVKDQEELAEQVLSWITCAKRLLTTTELQHALAVESGKFELDKDYLPDIEDMVSVCGGLVTVDEESNIIRLVHYTTQEYFERTQKYWFPDAETDITIICVTYLSFRAFENGVCQTDNELEERLRSNQLYSYAAHNWGHHAHQASTLRQEFLDFLESEAKVEASSQVMMGPGYRYRGYSQHIPRHMTGLHLAAYFGLEKVASALLKVKRGTDLTDSYGRTPLSYAAENNGYEAIVKLLLETEGVEADLKDNGGRSPLLRAAHQGHEAVVKLLLQNRAAPDFKDNFSQTPLWCVRQFRCLALVHPPIGPALDSTTTTRLISESNRPSLSDHRCIGKPAVRRSHADDETMPVPARFKQTLEVALRGIVRSGPIPWGKLKPSLASYGFAFELRDEYRQDIIDMFLEFLESAENSSHSPSVSSDQSSVVHYNRQAKSTKDRARETEDGWVRPAEISGQKEVPELIVRLAFGSRKENRIGAHIINRYEKRYKRHLARQDEDDIVELVCGLNSRPDRTYDIKFRVEEDADFDILLGKYWEGEPDETRNRKSR
jgi:hypothetical protein